MVIPQAGLCCIGGFLSQFSAFFKPQKPWVSGFVYRLVAAYGFAQGLFISDNIQDIIYNLKSQSDIAAEFPGI